MGSTNFDCRWKQGEVGRSCNLISCGRALWFLLLQNTTEVFFNLQETWHLSQLVAPHGLQSGFQYYGLTTPACDMPGLPHSSTWGTQPSCPVGRAPQPPARVLSTIQLPFMTSLALLGAYSFDTQTGRPIRSKFNMNVPQGILHRPRVGIFDPSKNMPAITKGRRQRSTVFLIYLQND